MAFSSTTDSQVPLELVEAPSLVGSGRYIITEFSRMGQGKDKTKTKATREYWKIVDRQRNYMGR